jgi:hypothetical protein
MSRFRILRIVGYFVLTFALGLLSGWLLKPAPPESISEHSGPSSQRLMQNLDAALKLTPEQKTRLQPVLDEWQRKAEEIVRRPRRRRELFEEYVPRVRDLLTTEQQTEFDRYVAQSRARFEKRIR